MFKILSNYFNQYKFFFYVGFVIVFILSIVFGIKFIYDKGYKTGKNEAEIQLNKDYQVALENKLKEQQDLLQKNFNILIENERKKEKVKEVFIDRAKQVKEITKADNFKCSMTDEQVNKLNQLTRIIK